LKRATASNQLEAFRKDVRSQGGGQRRNQKTYHNEEKYFEGGKHILNTMK